MLKDDNQLLAYGRFFLKGDFHADYASIGRILVHPEYRKKQLGNALLKYILEEVESRFEYSAIKISDQTYLLVFYVKYVIIILISSSCNDGISNIYIFLYIIMLFSCIT